MTSHIKEVSVQQECDFVQTDPNINQILAERVAQGMQSTVKIKAL